MIQTSMGFLKGGLLFLAESLDAFCRYLREEVLGKPDKEPNQDEVKKTLQQLETFSKALDMCARICDDQKVNSIAEAHFNMIMNQIREELTEEVAKHADEVIQFIGRGNGPVAQA